MRARLRGSPAPLAALHAQAGELLPGGLPALRARLAALHGRPVVINKWASWCVPCRAEFGAFQRVSRRARARGRVHRHRLRRHQPRRRGARSCARFPVSYPSYYDRERRAGHAITDSTFTPVTVFYNRRGEQYIHQGPYPSAAKLERRRPALRAGRLTRVPEMRIDPLSGHRTIVAGERSRRPGGEPRCAPPRADRPRARPVRRGPRGPHAARALRACARTAGAPNSPGWTVRVVPNLYPALDARRATEPRAPASDARARGRERRSCSPRTPATGAHEVIVNGPQPVLSLAELPVEQVVAAVEVWRERMRAHARRAPTCS